MQSKGMEDSPLKEINEMKVTKLSDIEFKVIVTKMLKEVADNYKELSENYNSMKKEIETINKNQEEEERWRRDKWEQSPLPPAHRGNT